MTVRGQQATRDRRADWSGEDLQGPQEPKRVSPAPAAPSELSFTVRSRTVLTIMAVAIVTLVALGAAGQVAKHAFGYPHVVGLVEHFNLNNEANLPTWYQSIAMLATALAAGVVALHEKAAGNRYWRHWAGIALIFVYLSADEGGSIHEATIDPLQRITNFESGMWSPTWVLFALGATVVVAVIYARFFFAHLSLRERVQTATAATLSVDGAVGMGMAAAAVVFSATATIPTTATCWSTPSCRT